LKEPVVGILCHATHILKKEQNFKQAMTTFLKLLLSHVVERTRGGNPPPRRPQPKKEPNFKQATTTF
jgi:hypothetical protein